MSASENIDLLTPGTVWLRRDGSSAKFLFLTNQKLTAKTQQRHPPQVIYADKNGNIFNRDVDDFFGTYQFLNVDGELEKKIENLFVFNAEDYATVADPADEPESESKTVELVSPTSVNQAPDEAAEETLADSLLRELTATSHSSERALTVAFGVSDHPGLKNPTLTAADLSEAVVLYSQEPNKTYNLTQHRLLFKLTDTITVAKLVEVFHPSSELNTVDWFAIKTALGSDTIVWDSWIGVYPEYSAHGLYASVLVGSSEAPVDKQETPGIEAVDTSPNPMLLTPGLPTEITMPATSGYAQVISEVRTEVPTTTVVTEGDISFATVHPLVDNVTQSVAVTTPPGIPSQNLPSLHNADGSVMTAEQIMSLVQAMDLSSVSTNLGVNTQANVEPVQTPQQVVSVVNVHQQPVVTAQ